MRFVEQRSRFVEAANPPQVRIDSRMVFEILPSSMAAALISAIALSISSMAFLRVVHFAAIGMR